MSAFWSVFVLDTDRSHVSKESIAIIALWELNWDPTLSVMDLAPASPLVIASDNFVFLCHDHTLLVAFAPRGCGDPAARYRILSS